MKDLLAKSAGYDRRDCKVRYNARKDAKVSRSAHIEEVTVVTGVANDARGMIFFHTEYDFLLCKPGSPTIV